MFPIVIQEQIAEKELTALNRIVLGSRRVFNTVFYAVLLVILIGLQVLLFVVTGQIRAMIAAFTAVLLLIFLYWLVGVPLIIGNLVKKQVRRNGVEQAHDRVLRNVSGRKHRQPRVVRRREFYA